ncbi:MAG: cyclic nucleotide-binding domain-containing protein [Gemmatimonadaceae bacterium]
MEFSGTECIPESVSLLETHVAGNRQRFQHLQERDGYQDTLAVHDREYVETGPDVDAIASAIDKISLFRVLTRDEIVGVARRARVIHLGPQERIIVQGRTGSSLFVIYDGELEVIAKRNGRDRVIAQLGRGAVVGETSFLTGQARTASVRAIEIATVIEISASLFRPVVRDRPAILEELIDLMSKRVETERRSKKSLLSKVSAAIFAPAFDESTPFASPHSAVRVS